MTVLNVVKFSSLLFTLLIISWRDMKIERIENYSLLPIFCVGLIGFSPISALLGFFSVSVPMLTIALLTNEGIGGGDIKLMAACGFALGPMRSVTAAAIGLMLAGLFALLRLIWKQKKAPIPLAPFLSLGCATAMMLQPFT